MPKQAKLLLNLEKKLIILMQKNLSTDGLKDILVSRESLYGKILHKDIKVNDDEEEGTFKIGTELNDTVIQQIWMQIFIL